MSKVLFWDFDGTLVYDNEAFPDALQKALKEQGFQVPKEETTAFIHGVNSRYFPEKAYPDKTGPLWWNTLWEHAEGFYAEHQIGREHWKELNENFRKHVIGFPYTVYEDAKKTLARCLELGYQNYVISNNYPELPEVIAAFGLSDYFTDYFVSACIGYEKPRPELFGRAKAGTGFPQICYMIGDNPVADVLGGKAAGMKTILVHRTCDSEADYQCQELAQIPSVLE